MRLADNEIEIDLGHEVVRLKPTLRAAFRLARKYENYKNLFDAVTGCSITAISDVIKAGSTQTTSLAGYLDGLGEKETALMISLSSLIWPVVSFIDALSGVEIDEPVAAGEPISFTEYHTKLFSIATGWLGWTPEQAWNATPAEILAAQKGRVEMLSVVFGGKRDEADTIDGSNEDARHQLNALGDLSIQTMAEIPCA